MIGLDLIPYDKDAHGAFVETTFVETLKDTPPWCWGSPSGNRRVLSRVLRDPTARVVVAIPLAHPQELIGWAATIHGALVFVYVRPLMRQVVPDSALVDALALPPPVPVAYWTLGCAARAAEGWPGFFDPRALRSVTAMAH
jgi:hypothetical protein